MTRTLRRNRLGLAGVLPFVLLCSASGCVPGAAVNQVLGESFLLLATTAIQSVTALVFNTFFGMT